METMMERHPDDNNMSADRVLVLKPIDGETVKDSRGLTDKRLWTGENEVHAYMDQASLLWKVKYSIGDTPPVLKQSWTSFKRLRDFVEPYYNKRGLQIIEVKD